MAAIGQAQIAENLTAEEARMKVKSLEGFTAFTAASGVKLVKPHVEHVGHRMSALDRLGLERLVNEHRTEGSERLAPKKHCHLLHQLIDARLGVAR